MERAFAALIGEHVAIPLSKVRSPVGSTLRKLSLWSGCHSMFNALGSSRILYTWFHTPPRWVRPRMIHSQQLHWLSIYTLSPRCSWIVPPVASSWLRLLPNINHDKRTSQPSLHLTLIFSIQYRQIMYKTHHRVVCAVISIEIRLVQICLES